MVKTAKNNPNFDDYLSGYSLYMGGVSLTNKECLGFKEKHYFSCLAKATCIVSIAKIKNKESTLRRRRKAQKYNNQIPAARFAHNWHTSFSKKELSRLFNRYYVDGFTSFCLAIIPENTKGLPLYKFLLPEYLLEYKPNKFSKKQLDVGVDHYYEQWIDEIRGNFGNKCMNKADFIKFLRKIRQSIECFEKSKNINKNYCGILNELSKKLPKEQDITADIIFLFLNSFIETLIKNKSIIVCKNCGSFAKYFRNKKFCSKNVDGRNCLQRYFSNLDYKKFRAKRLKVKRAWMQKTRKEIPNY